MIKTAALAITLTVAALQAHPQASKNDEAGVRDLIARWNSAYTSLDSVTLAGLETADFELVDRFGHWIKTDGPEFNERLWALTFRDIYHGKPGPARQIESKDLGSVSAPRVAVDGQGRGAAVWLQVDGTHYDMWSNRYE